MPRKPRQKEFEEFLRGQESSLRLQDAARRGGIRIDPPHLEVLIHDGSTEEEPLPVVRQPSGEQREAAPNEVSIVRARLTIVAVVVSTSVVTSFCATSISTDGITGFAVRMGFLLVMGLVSIAAIVHHHTETAHRQRLIKIGELLTAIGRASVYNDEPEQIRLHNELAELKYNNFTTIKV